MSKACLIIVFNHRYDRNIPVLEKLYGDRFSHIYFLVPFYDGDHPNVIPVYESSHYFQSFFAQGFHRFFKEEFTHYIFTGDDCLLNPTITEDTVTEATGVPEGVDFIPGIIQLHQLKGQPWWHAYKGIEFFTNRKGAEIRNELPTREEAVARFKKHGIEIQPLSADHIFGTERPPSKKWWEYWLFRQYHTKIKWRRLRKNGKIELPYPVVGSYSDILIISKHTIRDFCRNCGIMAAAGLFVEIAIPTSLLLASSEIMEEKDTKLKGLALWTAADITAVEQRFDRSLARLMKEFPKEQLFYHPVKLSKWKNDL